MARCFRQVVLPIFKSRRIDQDRIQLRKVFDKEPVRDGSDKLQMNFRQKVRDNREAVLRRDVSDSHPFAGTSDASYIRLENPG